MLPKSKFPFLLLLISQISIAQNCICDSKPALKELISCEPTLFKNGAKIYWQYNCDESQLIFQNKTKVILDEQPLVELTGRLGFTNWIEYTNTFLIENRLASGCCDPPDYILFDKHTGIRIVDLGPILFYSTDEKFPIIVALDSIDSNIVFKNIDNDRSFEMRLAQGRIEKTMQVSNIMHPESLFHEGKIENGIFEITYRYKEKESENDDENDSDWKTEKITVDLKKSRL
jgi:hypothetical protein